MTDHEIRTAIGEMVEPHPIIEWNAVSPDGTASCMSGASKREVEDWLAALPKDSWAKSYTAQPWKIYKNYPRCIDAMRDALEYVLSKEQCDSFGLMLLVVTGHSKPRSSRFLDVWIGASATARQLAETFLKVFGKWKEAV